jgi:hypothetical protein
MEKKLTDRTADSAANSGSGCHASKYAVSVHSLISSLGCSSNLCYRFKKDLMVFFIILTQFKGFLFN